VIRCRRRRGDRAATVATAAAGGGGHDQVLELGVARVEQHSERAAGAAGAPRAAVATVTTVTTAGARGAMLAQLGVLPNPSGLTLPHYRIRFYTRTQLDRDMPPSPPGIGPSVVAEPSSVARAGDHQRRSYRLGGLRRAAAARRLQDCALLSRQQRARSTRAPRRVQSLHPGGGTGDGLPAVFPPEGPGLPPESQTPAQKAQLLAFLQLL
jgi:hypothetical protein